MPEPEVMLDPSNHFEKIVGFEGESITDFSVHRPLVIDQSSGRITLAPRSEDDHSKGMYTPEEIWALHMRGRVTVFGKELKVALPYSAQSTQTIIVMSKEFINALGEPAFAGILASDLCIDLDSKQERFAYCCDETKSFELRENWSRELERRAIDALLSGTTDADRQAEDFIRLARYTAASKAARENLLILRGVVLSRTSPADVVKLHQLAEATEFPDLKWEDFQSRTQKVNQVLASRMPTLATSTAVSQRISGRRGIYTSAILRAEVGLVIGDSEKLYRGLPANVRRGMDALFQEMKEIRQKR